MVFNLTKQRLHNKKISLEEINSAIKYIHANPHEERVFNCNRGRDQPIIFFCLLYYAAMLMKIT